MSDSSGIGTARTEGPCWPTYGSPRKLLSSIASRVITNPTAIWFSRSSMLANATSDAMSIPTPAAARNPRSTLPVV